MLIRHSRIFRTHDDAGRIGITSLGIVVVSLFRSRYNLEAAILQVLDGLRQVALTAYRQRVQGTGRSLDGIRIHAHAVLRRNYNGIDSGTLTRTGDGTEIAHVGHPVEHDEQRILSLFKEIGNDVFRPLIGNGRDESHDSLMILLRNAVQAFHRYALHRNKRILQYGKKLFRQIALNILLHQYLVDFLSGLYRFNHGSDAKYHFIFLKHITFLICHLYLFL